jgi:hypothetical protein
MPDRLRLRRLGASRVGPRRVALQLAVLTGLLLIAALPTTSLAASGRQQSVEHITIADVPGSQGEDCVDDPNAQPGVGLKKCETPFTLATLVPFVIGGVVLLLAVAVGWYLVMRRRASRPFLPDEAVLPGGTTGAAGVPTAAAATARDWWTCKSCGATNMNGVARCYKCGAWPR